MKVDLQTILKSLNETPRRIPSIFCYDALGSQYFEERCGSPEYYLTRTERGLLECAAAALPRLLGETNLIELGCGNGEKLAPLLSGFADAGIVCNYIGIDVSRQALNELSKRLEQTFPKVSRRLIEETFDKGLKGQTYSGTTPLILFLGSTLGNMNNDEIASFFSMIRSNMHDGCHILLGVDFVKDPGVLEAAYDDSDGAGRRMEINALKNLNEYCEGNIDLGLFEYETSYDASTQIVQAKLICQQDQQINFNTLNHSFTLGKGDYFQVGMMRKFTEGQIITMTSEQGFGVMKYWVDTTTPYGLFLLKSIERIARAA